MVEVRTKSGYLAEIKDRFFDEDVRYDGLDGEG